MPSEKLHNWVSWEDRYGEHHYKCTRCGLEVPPEAITQALDQFFKGC